MTGASPLLTHAMILTATIPPDASEAPDDLIAQVRRLAERQIAMGRRILVVPVLTSYGGTESAIEEQLQGRVRVGRVTDGFWFDVGSVDRAL